MLQVGCGSGHETIEILKYVGKDTKLTVSDFDEEMLELCKTRVLEYNEIIFSAQNVLELDFPDNTFDRVIASLVIHIPGFAVGAQQAASELFRILQPGGIAAFTQFGNQYEASVWNLSVKAINQVYQEIQESTMVAFLNHFQLE